MRAPSPALLALALAASVACVSGVSDSFQDDGSGAPGGTQLCGVDAECVPAGSTCCACPTFALSIYDPASVACSDVQCPNSCSENVTARCNEVHRCELVCKPLACDQTQCADGYVMDKNGCMTCECAAPMTGAGSCVADTECQRTRGDCCGCLAGGFDTAVHSSTRAAFDMGLNCEDSPACPGINTCTSDVPTCVQGGCRLVSPDLPVGACGRADLPPCGPDLVCVVNVSDQANMHGVGVCSPPP